MGDQNNKNKIDRACGTYEGQGRCKQGFGGETQDHLEDLGIDGRIILKCIFNKWDWEAWIGLIRLRIGQVVGSCECNNESLGSVKWGEFLDYLKDMLAPEKGLCCMELIS